MTGPISAWRALALAERARAPRPEGTAEPDELARFRLGQWRDLSPFRSGDALARRLADEALDDSPFDGSFERLLAEPAAAVGERLPEAPGWLRELNAAFSDTLPGLPFSEPPLPLPSVLENDPAAGFLELIRPLIDRARGRLRQRIAAICRERNPPFTPETGERWVSEPLALHLLPLLARTLVLELNVARLQGLLAGGTAEERFAAFVERLRQPEIAAAILDEYPVLARVMVEELDAWVEVSAELLDRLAADWPDLVATFFGGQDPGPLTALDGGAGDRHRGGRAVRILKFASGAKLVYKPRPMAVDSHFQELLAWVESKGEGLAFRRLAVLDRGEHGWMEYAAPAECASLEEVALYHRRLGGLLALLYALEATDCHYENLIAAGDQPVVVDLESLFHPRWEIEEAAKPDERLAGEALGESVLRIGLLPFRVGEGVDAVDLSGVSSVAGQPTPQPVLQWRGIGTDEMRMVRERGLMEGASNLPSLDGRRIEAGERTGEMAAGFAAVYRLLVRHREELLAAGGMLDRFADDPVRAVLRPTRVYGLLLAESFHPDVLRDALDRDLLFDRLWVGIEEQPVLARAIPAEHRDLRAGDIPAFLARPSSIDAWTSRGERLPGFFLEARAHHRPPPHRAAGGGGPAAAARPAPPLPRHPAPQPRRRGLVRLRSRGPRPAARPGGAARAADRRRGGGGGVVRVHGAARWGARHLDRPRVPPAALVAGADAPGPLRRPSGGSPVPGLPGRDDGRGALDRARPGGAGEPAGTASRGRDRGRGPGGRYQGGRYQGGRRALDRRLHRLGGLLYTIAHLAALWRDPRLLAAAERMAERLPARIASDDQIDVVGGAAGAIFGLLALHRASGSPGRWRSRRSAASICWPGRSPGARGWAG